MDVHRKSIPQPYSRYANLNKAATIIQAAFRGHLTRRRLKQRPILRKRRTSYDRAYQLARERSAKADSHYYRAESADRVFGKPNQKIMSMLLTNMSPERPRTCSQSQM